MEKKKSRTREWDRRKTKRNQKIAISLKVQWIVDSREKWVQCWCDMFWYVRQTLKCTWMPLPVPLSLKHPRVSFPAGLGASGKSVLAQPDGGTIPLKGSWQGTARHAVNYFLFFLPWHTASLLWIPVSAPYLDEEFIQQKLPEDTEWKDQAREAWWKNTVDWLSGCFIRAPITLHWGPFESVFWLDLSVLSLPPLDPRTVSRSELIELHTASFNLASVSWRNCQAG